MKSGKRKKSSGPREIWGRYFGNLFAIGVIGSLVWYFIRHWTDFTSILNASRFHVTALILLCSLSIFLNGIQSFIILRALGLRIGFWENQAVALTANICNYAPLRPGTIIRIKYLKNVHGLDYVRFGAMVSVRFLALTAASTFLGLLGLLGARLNGLNVHPALAGLILGLFIVSCLLLFVRSSKAEGPDRNPAKLWKRFYWNYRDLNAKSGTLWMLMAIVILHCIVFSFRLVIAYDAIGVGLSFYVALILAPSLSIIGFLNITPGNLGLREWALGLFSLSTGYNFGDGIFAGTMDHAIALVCTFLLGSLASVYVFLKMKRVKNAGICSI